MDHSTIYDAGILSDICLPSRQDEIELPDLFLLHRSIAMFSRSCLSQLPEIWESSRHWGHHSGKSSWGCCKKMLADRGQSQDFQPEAGLPPSGRSDTETGEDEQKEHALSGNSNLECFSIVIVKAWCPQITWQLARLLVSWDLSQNDLLSLRWGSALVLL